MIVNYFLQCDPGFTNDRNKPGPQLAKEAPIDPVDAGIRGSSPATPQQVFVCAG